MVLGFRGLRDKIAAQLLLTCYQHLLFKLIDDTKAVQFIIVLSASVC